MNTPMPATVSESPSTRKASTATLPLFKNHPHLREQLPYVSLGQFPTPVERLPRIGASLGLENLFIKRDDLSGTVYGGNKVRKLEFLLGDALRAHAKEVITSGFAGSNHALATAIYAQQLGLKSVSMLVPQPNAHYVRRNLLASHHYQAELCHYANRQLLSIGLIGRVLQSRIRHGVAPYVVPAGGSSAIGVIGYVNAALELKEQILAGKMPQPDCIYVPMGSMGTTAGLMLGLKAAGLTCRVIAVRAIEEQLANTGKLIQFTHDTAALLHKLDRTVPQLQINVDELCIRNEYLGEGYAHFTEKSMKAAARMKAEGGILLNETYSGKAFAALIDDAESQALKGKTVLFWNTYNSRDLSPVTAGRDYHQLPAPFHRYFEEAVQPLDRPGQDR